MANSVVKMSKELKQAISKELQIAATEIYTPSFSEVGHTGLRRFGGYVYEEFLPQLRWPRAGKIYQEMSTNDPVVGAVLYVCEQLIRNASWRVESTGTNRVDTEAKEFLTSCMHDMSATWTDTIAEVLTMLPYGFSWHEEVYKRRDGDVRNPKRRSKYADGRIGWRKIPGRSQHTMTEWVFDDKDDGIIAMIQEAAPHYQKTILPLEKSLLFRARVEHNNPEGRSMLRNAYRPWYFKKHIEEIEGIGIERDLAGLPVITPPEGVDIWNPNDPRAVQMKAEAEKMVRNIRRDQNEGVVKPFGWELELLSTGSRRQFDTNAIINRYDQRIAITLLADLIMLGGDKVGSFALANVKRSILGSALEAILDTIVEVFNRYAIPRLFKVNAFPGLKDYPKLVVGEILTPSLTELARYLQILSASQMPLFPDQDLENYLRSIAGMPKRGPASQAMPLDGNSSTGTGRLTGVSTDDARIQNQGLPQEAR